MASDGKGEKNFRQIYLKKREMKIVVMKKPAREQIKRGFFFLL